MIFGSDVINPFLSLLCNYRCPYCITRHGHADFGYVERAAADWLEALNGLEDVNDVVFNGGEPGLFPGFADIVNGLAPRGLVAIGTNASEPAMEGLLKIRPRPNLIVDVSFHPAMTDENLLVPRLLRLRDAGLTVRVHAVTWPLYFGREEAGLKTIAEKTGLQTFLQPFEGFCQDEFFNGGHPMKTEATDGNPRKVECWRTRYTPVAPNGDVYLCHALMYARSPYGILGNLFDGFMPPTEFLECDQYGRCNPCDFPRKVVAV